MPFRVSSVIAWAVPFGMGDKRPTSRATTSPSRASQPAVHTTSRDAVGASPGASSLDTSPELSLPPAWLHEHTATLWRIIARLGVPRHQVDDVLQETFITAARRRAEIVEGRERAFLIGTATRLCANYRRRAHVRHEVAEGQDGEHASPEPDAERLLMRKRLRQRLDLALASLSDAHRSVFVLYELEGLSVPEIAELSGVPVNTVASRLGRARAKFAEAAARLERADGALEEP